MDQDYYMLLGVGPTATEDEIVRAYRRMALIYHPDKNNHPESVEHFKKIQAAFQVLSNWFDRAIYDRSAGRRPNPGPSRPRTTQQTTSYTQESTAPSILPVLGVIGVGILGLIGISKMFSSNNNDDSDDES